MTANRWLALNHGLLIAFGLLVIGVAFVGGLDDWGRDARAYRLDLSEPYGEGLGGWGAYLYSPAFAQVVAPVANLVPLRVFLAVWSVVLIGLLGWLGGRWAAILLLLVPPVALEIYYGNIHLLLATAIVLGFRYPAAWAFVLLTKVTPGIGLLWFVARRDWRSLTVALGATAAVASVSFLAAPDLWHQWFSLLADQGSRPAPDGLGVLSLGPLWARLVMAGAIALAGGLLGYRWPVAVAATVAMPVIWVHTPSMVVAAGVLAVMDRREPLPRMVRLRSRGVAASEAPVAEHRHREPGTDPRAW